MQETAAVRTRGNEAIAKIIRIALLSNFVTTFDSAVNLKDDE